MTTICDFSEERLAEVSARNPGLDATPRPSDVLANPEIDVVSICSYDNFHYEQVREALLGDKQYPHGYGAVGYK